MSLFNKLIVQFVQLMPKSVVGFFSKKYIAGESLEHGIKAVQELNSIGIYATMDVLGESVTNKEEAIAAKNACLEVLNAIKKHNLLSNLSIKPTQMGLAIDEDFAYEQVLELVKKANEINNFVRIDMEDSPYTDATINLYKRIYENYKNVGIVFQSYLKRTYDDVVILNKLGTNYRLCKGIYVEPHSIAYKDKQAVRDNFMKSLAEMLKNGNYVGIATHDKYLIDESYKLIREMNIPNKKFEFQMLLGVREDLRDRINNDGYKIRIYVPFGSDWYAYSIRRLKENPSMAGHIVKSIISFGRL
ncbi:MAG TPA: proline dehydrogenase family protein [Ignavibacteriaceae bacterium]|nr:proline dehydrogenase family protein [Ignavibacteriaceae bacterium]